jgi:hypothetical protein
MTRVIVYVLAAGFLAAGSPLEAQSRRSDPRDRRDAARAQGIPPGHLPPASQCRVWYDGRPPGRQPAPTSCARAQAVAQRDGNARVIYGEDAYWDSDTRRGGYGGYSDRNSRDRDDDDNDRAVRRGTVRDPRNSSNRGEREGGSVAFRNGYRDGMTKGREDAEDGDRYDPARHSWHRNATRGYENRHGTRYEYIERYRAGFEDGYAQGYRVYRRR